MADFERACPIELWAHIANHLLLDKNVFILKQNTNVLLQNGFALGKINVKSPQNIATVPSLMYLNEQKN
jgi:hypothetical protein